MNHLSEENVNPNTQALEPDRINPNISRQPLMQEENPRPDSPRPPSRQTDINPHISSQPLKQESITPVPSHENANQSGQKTLERHGIFVYGTLMAEEFLSWVLTGSAENHKTVVSLRQPATLRFHRCVAVSHADYPALIQGNESDQVEGFLVTPSTRSQWKKLDDFEGESYRRQCVQVESSDSKRTVPAFVYLWQDSMDKLLPYQDWSYAYFREHRLEDWLDLFEGMEMVGDGWSFFLLSYLTH